MSILEDHNKIQEIASEIKVSPPEQTWDKISHKLEKRAHITKRKRSNLILNKQILKSEKLHLRVGVMKHDSVFQTTKKSI